MAIPATLNRQTLSVTSQPAAYTVTAPEVGLFIQNTGTSTVTVALSNSSEPPLKVDGGGTGRMDGAGTYILTCQFGSSACNVSAIAGSNLRPLGLPQMVGNWVGFNTQDFSGTNDTNAGSNTARQAVVDIYFPAGCTEVAFVWDGMVQLAGSPDTETPISAALTIDSCYLEVPYNSGNYTQIFFGNNAGTVINPGQRVVSDTLSFEMNAPTRCSLIINDHVAAANTLPFNYYVSSYSNGLSQYEQYAGVRYSTTPFSGTSGRVNTSSTGTAFAPYAIIGTPYTPTFSAAIIGDSISQGRNDSKDHDLVQYPWGLAQGWVNRLLSGVLPFSNLSRSGWSGYRFNTTSGNARKGMAKYAQMLIWTFGANDVVHTNIATYTAAFLDAIQYAHDNGLLFCACTNIPRTNDVSGVWLSYITGGTQAITGFETFRQQINALMRSTPTVDVLLDFDKLIDPAQTGLPAQGTIIYSGTASTVTTNFGIGSLVDSGLSVFGTNALSSPADGYGPYIVYFPSGANAGVFAAAMRNSGSNLTINSLLVNAPFPLVSSTTNEPYQILDPSYEDGVHPSPRTHGKMAAYARSILSPMLNF